MEFSVRNALTVMLIVVIAVPASSSPALRHSHADGDKSHSHRAPVIEHHGHSHSHGPSHCHSSHHRHRKDVKTAKHAHCGREAHTATPPVEHYHVFWFGFTASLPLRMPDRSDSRPTMLNVDQWVPLVSAIQLPVAGQDGSALVAVGLRTPTGLTPRLPDRSQAHRPQRSAMVLLCDTARRERSGVLVI